MESPFSWRIIFFLIFISIHSISCDRDNLLTYTDQFVLHYDGPAEAAKEIASKHGFIYLNQIFDKRYHLRHPSRTKRSIEPSHNFSDISRELNVSFLQHLPVLSRTKRDLISLRSVETLDKYNDPNWSQMWYLNRGNGLDMNVQKVWDQNITGHGVVVSILDDGLEGDHPDLVENYDPQASYDVNNSDDDPTPRYDIIDSNRHGTRCAGEVAAMANNNKCVVGVAYHAKVGGVRMLDGDVTDAVEARSIGFATDHIDIYSASWGPDDDGKTVDGPGELAARAFVDGVTKGRKGLGSIYIWASGNGGREHDNCNCDGYTNSIWTLSVSSATENGQVPWYSEACSSTLATTYSSGSIGEKQIVTTDLHHGCTISHTGTSASAPLAAAITALALEANRNLTWRDMQHIVAMTSKPGNLHAPDWKTNGVGRKVSHSFGYGLMDATALVDLAKVWVSVPEKTLCEIKSNFTDKLIPSKSYVEMSLNVKCTEVLFLEHVQSRINLSSTRRGDIHIYLTSPAGTRSTLLEKRLMDSSHSGFQDWPFMTVHTWGENPNGIWKLEVHNDGRYPQSRAFLKAWTMVLHGTKINPDRRKRETLSNESTLNPEIPVNSSVAATQLNHTISFNSTLKSVNPPLNANGLESTVGENTRTNTVDNSKDIFVSHWTRENDRPKTKVNSMESNSENSGCRVKGFNGCLDCLSNYILFRSNCVTQCPRGYFKESKISLHQSNDQSFICANCYYNCFTCNGPNDFNCTTCYGDSLLNYGRCEKRELREALDSLYTYYHRITAIVIFLFLFTLGLTLYVIAERVPNLCKLCCYFRYPKRRATTRFYDGFTPSDEPTSSSSNFLRLKSVTKLHANYSHLSEEENDR